MRHKKKVNHLSRKRGHRHAMLSNMAASLIVHKRIRTTTAKAKALKVYIEPLITKAKEDTTHSRRHVFSYLQDKDATSELFRDVAEKIGDRPGGYTRIIKLGNRLGDNADICIIELVDYNEVMLADTAAAAKSSKRRRRGGKKKSQVDEATPSTVAEDSSASESAVNEVKDEVKENVTAADDVAVEESADEQPASEASAEESPEVENTEEPVSETPAGEKKTEDTASSEEPMKSESSQEPEKGKEDNSSEEKEKKE